MIWAACRARSLARRLAAASAAAHAATIGKFSDLAQLARRSEFPLHRTSACLRSIGAADHQGVIALIAAKSYADGADSRAGEDTR